MTNQTDSLGLAGKTERNRLKPTRQEDLFTMYKRITAARHNETMRVAELIEMALYSADSEETLDALVALAVKVLKP